MTTVLKVTAVLLALALVTPVTAVPTETTANDEFEPNDDLSSAAELSPGEYSDLELVSDEDDYFAVSVSAGETLDVTATFPKQDDDGVADNDPEVRLVDADGNYLDGADTRTEPADDTVRYRLQWESEADQTVYLHVYGDDDVDASTSYDLSVARAANDEFEPNGDLATAQQLEPGEYSDLTLLDSEDDYFAISVSAGETLDVTATFPKVDDGDVADNEPAVRVVDADGNYLDAADTRTEPADDTVRYHLQYESDSDRTVYLRVYGSDDREVSTTYDLSVARAANDEFEPNGVLGAAPQLDPGTYTDLTLLDGEDDYYAVSVGAGETLNVTATFPKRDDGDVADNEPVVSVVDADGNYLDGADTRSEPADDTVRYHLQYESDSDRTVYLRVYGSDDREVSTTYDLSLERGANDEFEPNGALGNAASIGAGEYTDLTLLDDEDDYYAVSVPAGETLDVTATFPKLDDGNLADNDPGVALYDGDGNFLEGADRETNPADDTVRFHLQWESDSDRTVYLRVYGGDDRETWTSYDLTVGPSSVGGGSGGVELSSLSVPGEVAPGDDVTASVEVTNPGAGEVTTDVAFSLAGRTLDTQTVTIAGGETTTVTFSATVPDDVDPGGNTAGVAAGDESLQTDVEVRERTTTPPTTTAPATTAPTTTEASDGTATAGGTTERPDSDDDGVPDGEDYAPNDPEVQEKSDLEGDDDSGSPVPGFGVGLGLLAVVLASLLRRRRG